MFITHRDGGCPRLRDATQDNHRGSILLASRHVAAAVRCALPARSVRRPARSRQSRAAGPRGRGAVHGRPRTCDQPLLCAAGTRLLAGRPVSSEGKPALSLRVRRVGGAGTCRPRARDSHGRADASGAVAGAAARGNAGARRSAGRDVSRRMALAATGCLENYDLASATGGVVTTCPSFTGSFGPGLNDICTVPSLPSRR